MTDRNRRGLSSVSVVLEVEDEEYLDESHPRAAEENPRRSELYPIALLKIAMAMKKLNESQTVHFDEIMDSVLSGMIVDREDFARYMQRNMNRLVIEVQERDY